MRRYVHPDTFKMFEEEAYKIQDLFFAGKRDERTLQPEQS